MQPLGYWPFLRIVLVSGGWILLVVLLSVAWAVVQFRREVASSTSGGIASVSAGLNEPLLWLVIVPPIVLLVVWMMVRWFGKSPTV